MPFKYLAEMICDRVAASMIYLGDVYFVNSSPLEYYWSKQDENQFDDITRSELENWLENIATYGLDKTLKQIKMELQMEKDYEKYVRN